MTKQELIANIKAKSSLLCVGLDIDIHKIPRHYLQTDDPIFEFNKTVIDATLDLCVAYKPNIAFYESLGPAGWRSLEKTLEYIPSGIFKIADAKRGDIGNTSKMYAKTYFEYFNFDAVTVAPYMGEDSVRPFLEFDEKWVILLGLTSNSGSMDFQFLKSQSGIALYESVIRKAQNWGNPENMMFVIGATHPLLMADIRKMASDYFFLVPGIGTQGGDLKAIVENGKNNDCGLLINSSREIIYAGNDIHCHDAIRNKALDIQQQMAHLLNNSNL